MNSYAVYSTGSLEQKLNLAKQNESQWRASGNTINADAWLKIVSEIQGELTSRKIKQYLPVILIAGALLLLSR